MPAHPDLIEEHVKRVWTWADGFGTWHAEVDLDVLDEQLAERLARAALLAELTERAPRDTIPVFGLERTNWAGYQGTITFYFTEADQDLTVSSTKQETA